MAANQFLFPSRNLIQINVGNEAEQLQVQTGWVALLVACLTHHLRVAVAMNIYLLLAHPDKDSFNGQLADAYCQRARQLGHVVRYQQLGEMTFDPILHKGYKAVQSLEPDLLEAQQNIRWCNKWVIVYPVWWGNVPALLKGFLDRTLYSGFAYRYHDNNPFWDKLLAGREAELITTCDAPGFWLWWQYRNSDINALKRATLEFCGIRPVHIWRISRVRYLNEARRRKAIDQLIDSIPRAESATGSLPEPIFQPV